MTISEFVVQINAEACGPGRWKARCPAHDDSTPSLHITTAAQDGRILLHCFAGCSVDAVLRSLNLRACDLFAGPPPKPEKLAELRVEQERRETQRCRVAAERRSAYDRVDRLQLLVDALGTKLAQSPEDDTITSAFHDACEMLHRAECALAGIQTGAEGKKSNERYL